MTREEAIKLLDKWGVLLPSDADEALDMAIEALHRENAELNGYCHRIIPKEALKAKTDGDLISRQDAIEAVVCHIWHMPNEAYRQFNCENMVREVVEDAIKRLPSAEASQNLAEPNKELKGSDLISRQDAIDSMWKALYAYEDLTEKQFMEHEELELGDWFKHRIFVQRMHEECMKAVNSLPSAEPKTGEWIDIDDEPYCKCSKCGTYIDSLDDYYSFCPYCGADMRGGDDK